MKRSLAILGGLVFAIAARATTLVAVDVPHMSREADAIVRGTVRNVQSRWAGDHRRIFTEVEVSVAESLKGASAKTITIVQPGGVVGEVGQHVSGLPGFASGEEVLVFLEQRPDKRYLVFGMAQGKYSIERSSDQTAVFAIAASTAGARLVAPSGGPTVEPRREVVALEVLKAQVRAALAIPAPVKADGAMRTR